MTKKFSLLTGEEMTSQIVYFDTGRHMLVQAVCPEGALRWAHGTGMTPVRACRVSTGSEA